MVKTTPLSEDPFGATPAQGQSTPPTKDVKTTPLADSPFPDQKLEVTKPDIDETVSKSKAELNNIMLTMRGRDPDVDYNKGASYLAQVNVKDASNPQEAQLSLEKLYGKGNVGQDRSGNWWVKDNTGKKVAVLGGGISGALKGEAASLQAMSPEIAGSLAGGAIGTAALPGIGTVAGAGLGAAAGKGLDELRKWFTGDFAKTPKETAKEIGGAGVGGLVAEAGGQIAGKLGSTAVGALRKNFFGVTPESTAATESLLLGGAIPPVKTFAPSATISQYDQQLRNAVSGDPQRVRNTKFALQRLHDLLMYANVPENEIAETFSTIINPRQAVSTSTEGATITTAVREHITGLENEAKSSLETARKIAGNTEKTLNKIADSTTGDAAHGAFVQAAEEDRARWGATMSKAYDDVNEMLGGKKILSTEHMKETAAPIIAQLPKTGTPTIFHEVENLPRFISVSDAQRLQTRLREAAYSPNLTPGTVQHDYGVVRDAIGDTLDPDMGMFLKDTSRTSETALRNLRAVNAQYREGIQKYEDVKLNQLIRDYRSGKQLNPEAFAQSLFDTQSTFRVKSLRGLVGEDAWRAVQSADARNILRDATRLNGGSNPTGVSGQIIWRTLERRGEMLDAIYGKGTADAWRRYALQLSTLDGKVSPEALKAAGGDFSKALQSSVDAETKLQDFVKNDVLRNLRIGGPKEQDAAVRVLTRPGQEAQLDHAIKFFGEGSPAVGAIRSAAMKRILSDVVTGGETGVTTEISGASIDKFLSRYTKKEQEMLFPGGLADDLRTVADQFKSLFPYTSNDIGTSQAAATIKGNVPWHWRATLKYIKAKAVGYLLERPALIRAIADTSRQPGGRSIARDALSVLYRQAVIGGAEDTQEPGPTAKQGQAQ